MVHVYVLDVRGPVKVVPVPIRPMVGGTVALTASDAAVTGGAGYEGGEKQAIGFWTNVKDTVSWSFEAPAGTYKVEIEYAVEPASAGSTFQVAVDQAKVQGTAAATGGWSSFRTLNLGSIVVSSSGLHKLTVSALTMPKGAVMNLRGVRLTPAKG